MLAPWQWFRAVLCCALFAALSCGGARTSRAPTAVPATRSTSSARPVNPPQPAADLFRWCRPVGEQLEHYCCEDELWTPELPAPGEPTSMAVRAQRSRLARKHEAYCRDPKQRQALRAGFMSWWSPPPLLAQHWQLVLGGRVREVKPHADNRECASQGSACDYTATMTVERVFLDMGPVCDDGGCEAYCGERTFAFDGAEGLAAGDVIVLFVGSYQGGYATLSTGRVEAGQPVVAVEIDALDGAFARNLERLIAAPNANAVLREPEVRRLWAPFGGEVAVDCQVYGVPDGLCTQELDFSRAEGWVCAGMLQEPADVPVSAERMAAPLRSEIEGALSHALVQERAAAVAPGTEPEQAHALEWAWELQRGREGKASYTSEAGHAALYFVHARTPERTGFALARCTENGCLASPLTSERGDPRRPGAWSKALGALDVDRDGRREAVFESGQRDGEVDFGALSVVEQDGRHRKLLLWETAGDTGWQLLDGCALDDDTLLLVGSAWTPQYAAGCAVALSLTTFEPVAVVGELDHIKPQRPSATHAASATAPRIDLAALAGKPCKVTAEFLSTNGSPWLRVLNPRIAASGEAGTAEPQPPAAAPRLQGCGTPLAMHSPHLDL